ncbi:acetylglutamate kinase [Sinanaerobacter chloroacetimidivorans]|uniref:Acetylglutamate kinase n=1 Tax=Sinanaerobacter chloroacetimidivorans TaxID=2818044 RepID=A0A8J7W3F1_9FIRM|nr:acetylglutamate kinase [Sinanaerobacter chloroacetimidivorans]MBR0598205.1 acetylglutamate kinase [Sinanaerobacter chloroacetimidivorans]
MDTLNQNTTHITLGQMNLINKLRRLWMQLAMWRRAFLVSSASKFGDVDLIGERLYYAPLAFKDLFEVFFGEDIANQIQYYLTGQILIGAEILNAEKEGDRETVDEATQRMYENANEIAAYLAEINPYWNEETWRNLLYEYYRITILEMVTVLAGRYQESITLYESLEDQALKIADYMAEGFIKYFC